MRLSSDLTLTSANFNLPDVPYNVHPQVWISGYRPKDPITGEYRWQWAPTEEEIAASADPVYIEDQPTNTTFWSESGPDYGG